MIDPAYVAETQRRREYKAALEYELQCRVGVGVDAVFDIWGWKHYEKALQASTPVEEVVDGIDFDLPMFDYIF